MQPTRANVKRRVESLGGKFTDEGVEFSIDAPPSHIFTSSETHYGDFGVSGFIYDTKRDAYAAALSDMSLGVTKCDCDECRK